MKMNRFFAAAVALLLATAPALADTLSPNLGITLQSPGGNANTWGTINNSNLSLIDSKFGVTASIVTTGGTVTLTAVQQDSAVIEISGTLASNATVIFNTGGTWTIHNITTGAFSLTVKLAASTGTLVPQGASLNVFNNGTDILPGNGFGNEVAVAAAGTTNVLGAGGTFVQITGSGQTITSLGSAPNAKKYVRFTAGNTLTYNATSLILPSGTNIATAAGDTAIVLSDASGNARVVQYQKADGTALVVPAAADPIPIATVLNYAGSVAPARWLLMHGQAISRSTYSALFGVIGTTYGSGDGSTTFNIPDGSGRVIAGADNMSGSAEGNITSGGSGINGSALGAIGGLQNHTNTTGEMAAHSHTQGGTFASAGESVNHTHTQGGSFTSGSESADHTHTQTGTFTSGGQSADHSHTQGGSFGSDSQGAHTHSTTTDTGTGFASNGSGATAVSTYTGGTAWTSSSAGSHSHTTTISGQTGGTSANHTHNTTISGQTGSDSVAHTHSTTISGNTAIESIAHGHNVTISGNTSSAGSGSAYGIMPPTIILNTIIYAGV